MKTRRIMFGFAAGLIVLSTMPAQAQNAPRAARATEATDRVIVKFRDGRTPAQSAKHEAAAGDRVAALAARTRTSLQLARSVTPQVHALRLERRMAGGELQDAMARIARDAAVEYVVPDRRKYRSRIPSDPRYGTTPEIGQWWLTPPSATFVSPIDAEHAWDITTGSPQVVVAVIDTGVLFDHPDLGRFAQGGKVLPGYDMISDPAVANDGDGRDSDASDPGDWVTETEAADPAFKDCEVSDSSWHGTHVAGIIGARSNNGVGVAGIGWDNLVLPVRVLGKCFGFDSDILAGVRWAAGLGVPGVPANPNPARVLNLSLGSQEACSQPYIDALNELKPLGVLVVAAAGNDGAAASASPANCPGVISVTALRHVGTKVGFANWGTDVTIAAPGGNCVDTTGATCLHPIVSTGNDGKTQPGNMIYDGQLGTSFSTPMVAGVAALMVAANPAISVADLTQRLRLTARAFPAADPALLSCSDPNFKADAAGNLPNDGQCNCDQASCGAGMLDAAGAVRSATNPIALVSGPSTAVAGQTITLDGGASVGSPGFGTITYRWQIAGGGAASPGATDGSALALCATAGSYAITLTVSDASGHAESRTVPLQVSGAGTCGGGSSGDGGSGGGGSASAGNGGGGGGAVDVWQLWALIALAALGGFRVRRRD